MSTWFIAAVLTPLMVLAVGGFVFYVGAVSDERERVKARAAEQASTRPSA